MQEDKKNLDLNSIQIKANELIEKRNKLDVDYLFNNIQRIEYLNKIKELETIKNNFVSEIEEYKKGLK